MEADFSAFERGFEGEDAGPQDPLLRAFFALAAELDLHVERGDLEVDAELSPYLIEQRVSIKIGEGTEPAYKTLRVFAFHPVHKTLRCHLVALTPSLDLEHPLALLISNEINATVGGPAFTYVDEEGDIHAEMTLLADDPLYFTQAQLDKLAHETDHMMLHVLGGAESSEQLFEGHNHPRGKRKRQRRFQPPLWRPSPDENTPMEAVPPPAADTGAPPAADTGAPPAADTGAPPAADTGAPPAADPDVPPTS